MKVNAWLAFLFIAAVGCALEVIAGWALWHSLNLEQRVVVAAVWAAYAGIPILLGVGQLLLLGFAVSWVFRWYIKPLRAIAEETRIIAMSHPAHRLRLEDKPEVRDVTAGINLLAERYQALQDDVSAQIQAANAAVEDERRRLAALVSKLTQGVLVCNREGKILLYNLRAQRLLEGATSAGEKNSWIGLGRSVFGVLDENLLSHALMHIEHRLAQEEMSSGLVAPFVASCQSGRFVSVHLVPVLDKDRTMNGYILTLEDITRHTETETRLGKLLQALTEGQRSSVAGIRAAIETILEYPDMDEERQHQFKTIIHAETLKLSQGLQRMVADYSDYLGMQSTLEEMLGSDLLAALERCFNKSFGITVKVTHSIQPVWLRVDSYALVQALVFAMGQLREHYHAERIELKLEPQPNFASLAIVWSGTALDMETLRVWGKQTLLADQQGSAVTMNDVVERHGGAVWTQGEAGRNTFRLLLPLLVDQQTKQDIAAAEADEAAEDGEAHYYDFHLFHRPEQHSKLDEFPLTKLSYTVVDTETTGLNPSAGDEIIAIGAVRIVNERILKSEAFDCLINPRRSIAEAAVAIHGITPDMLLGKPCIDEILPRFQRFVEDTVIIGHNVAFDMRFIELKEARTGIRFSNPVLDTLLLACVIHPNQEGQTLEAVAKRLGVAVSGRHTALGDALTTAQIFLAMVPLLAERGIHTLGQASAACEGTQYARLKY